jgi:membrane protein
MQGDGDSGLSGVRVRDELARLVSRYRRVRDRLIPHEPEVAPERWRRGWLYTVYVWRRLFHEDRGGGMAAILTIHTLLSTIPSLGIALMIVGRMDPKAGFSFFHELFSSLVPDAGRAGEMAEGALQLADNVNVSNLGAWGFGATLLVAFALFSTLEATFNRIWRVLRQRSLLVKFTMFYTLATLGPAVVLISLAQPYVAGVAGTLSWPAFVTAIGLVLLNRFMPNTNVRWVPAIVGGLFSALLLELGKLGFGFYATRFALSTYEGVYGPLAIFPILLVWFYLSWMVILVGAEITFVVQRRGAIALQGYINRYVRERTQIGLDSGRTAARLMLAICDCYSRRGEGLPTEQLAERFSLSLDRVSELLGELMRNGYLIETEGEPDAWVPARPPDQILVVEVLALFEREHARLPRSDRLGELFAQLDAERERVAGETTYADLVGAPRRGRKEQRKDAAPTSDGVGDALEVEPVHDDRR